MSSLDAMEAAFHKLPEAALAALLISYGINATGTRFQLAGRVFRHVSTPPGASPPRVSDTQWQERYTSVGAAALGTASGTASPPATPFTPAALSRAGTARSDVSRFSRCATLADNDDDRLIRVVPHVASAGGRGVPASLAMVVERQMARSSAAFPEDHLDDGGKYSDPTRHLAGSVSPKKLRDALRDVAQTPQLMVPVTEALNYALEAVHTGVLTTVNVAVDAVLRSVQKAKQLMLLDAARRGCPGDLRDAIAQGADVNWQDAAQNGVSALMVAAREDHVGAVVALCGASGVDVNLEVREEEVGRRGRGGGHGWG